jgi:hypothetical protein
MIFKKNSALLIGLLLWSISFLQGCATPSTTTTDSISITSSDVFYSGVGINGSAQAVISFFYDASKGTIKKLTVNNIYFGVFDLETQTEIPAIIKVNIDGTFEHKAGIKGRVDAKGKIYGELVRISQSFCVPSKFIYWTATPMNYALFNEPYNTDISDINQLVQILIHENPMARYHAINSIGKKHDTNSINGLIEALKSVNPDVRWNAARLLGDIKESSGVESLINVLNDENPDVRWNAARSLGQFQNKAIIAPLLNHINDENEIVRWYAAESLANIDDSRIDNLFMGSLKNNNVEIIVAARKYFFHRNTDDADNLLVDALNKRDSDMGVGMAADFLNSGNAKLKKAAEDWLRSKGYQVRWKQDSHKEVNANKKEITDPIVNGEESRISGIIVSVSNDVGVKGDNRLWKSIEVRQTSGEPIRQKFNLYVKIYRNNQEIYDGPDMSKVVTEQIEDLEKIVAANIKEGAKVDFLLRHGDGWGDYYIPLINISD